MILLSLIFNKDLKVYLYDKLERKYLLQLSIRVIMGVMTLVCVYISIKALPLVMVGVVMNLSPLLTVVMSYFIFKKGLTRFDTGALIASFTGVILMITGGI